ncbi:hypothetical protein tpqmel_0323 [Candidatus Gastranaerophilus sp. (ex Termes propinquus)]|nr:hypothetical protein tpqmel_0323 [Candidatus Gastranaerophilus sp. (ex Termes propinquus)]
MPQEARFLIQVDTKAYQQKPSGKEMSGIKARIQGGKPKSLTVAQLAEVIKNGYSISPAILKGGLKAENWTQQQLFLVDIDNDTESEPLISIPKALGICTLKEVKPIMYYESYSHTTQKPKFRLVFAMDEPIFQEAKRKFIIETLISFFSQADAACTNADRIFFGTDKGVFLL